MADHPREETGLRQDFSPWVNQGLPVTGRSSAAVCSMKGGFRGGRNSGHFTVQLSLTKRGGGFNTRNPKSVA